MPLLAAIMIVGLLLVTDAKAQEMMTANEFVAQLDSTLAYSTAQCGQGDDEACSMVPQMRELKKQFISKSNACSASGDVSSPPCKTVKQLLTIAGAVLK